MIWFGLTIIVVDQLVKYFVQQLMYEGMSIPIIENIFHLTYVLNAGAAFGILENQRTFLIVLSLVFLGALFYYRRIINQESDTVKFGLTLFVSGALGNLIDRVKTGLVVDLFDFKIWPVFNIADIAICTGVGIIMWGILRDDTRKNI